MTVCNHLSHSPGNSPLALYFLPFSIWVLLHKSLCAGRALRPWLSVGVVDKSLNMDPVLQLWISARVSTQVRIFCADLLPFVRMFQTPVMNIVVHCQKWAHLVSPGEQNVLSVCESPWRYWCLTDNQLSRSWKESPVTILFQQKKTDPSMEQGVYAISWWLLFVVWGPL